jgi:hypothetical protein
MSIKLKLFSTLIIAFFCDYSTAQVRTTQNQWNVKGFWMKRYNPIPSDHPQVGVQFELTRTYYEECYQGPVAQAWEQGRYGCGWLPVNQPLKCNNWKDGENERSGPVDSDFHTCSTYLQAAEGETMVPETVKRLLRWRIIDFNEAKNFSDGPPDWPPPPFESLKVEIVNAVPLSQ